MLLVTNLFVAHLPDYLSTLYPQTIKPPEDQMYAQACFWTIVCQCRKTAVTSLAWAPRLLWGRLYVADPKQTSLGVWTSVTLLVNSLNVGVAQVWVERQQLQTWLFIYFSMCCEFIIASSDITHYYRLIEKSNQKNWKISLWVYAWT